MILGFFGISARTLAALSVAATHGAIALSRCRKWHRKHVCNKSLSLMAAQEITKKAVTTQGSGRRRVNCE